MTESDVINEMIDMLFLKRWRKRIKYDFLSESRRNETYFRYHNGEYIDETNIKYRVNSYSKNDIYNILIAEGGNKMCFVILCGKSGVYSTQEGLELMMADGLGGMLYLGNGVGYFQGEQYIGSPERYILVNTKKKGNPKLFG